MYIGAALTSKSRNIAVIMATEEMVKFTLKVSLSTKKILLLQMLLLVVVSFFTSFKLRDMTRD